MKKFLMILLGLVVLDIGICSVVIADQSLKLGYGWDDQGGGAAASAKYEEYRSVPKSFFIENYSLNKEIKNWELGFTAKNPLRSDQSYALNLEGPVKMQLAYDQTPHNISYNSKTIFTESSAGVFTLPASLKTDLQNTATTAFFNSTMASYVATAETPTNLSTLRKKASAKIDIASGSLFAFDLAVDQEKKTGSMPIAASMQSMVYEVAGPISYTTNNLKLHKNISIGAVQADASYKYTLFENDVKSIMISNPKRLTDALSSAESTRVTLAPNNKAQEANINIGMDLPMNGRFNGAVYYVRATQNDNFFPYTSNTKLTIKSTGADNGKDASDASNLPAASLNGRVDTLVQNYLISLNPMAGARFLLKYNSADVNNKTASITFPGYSSGDTSFSAALTPESDAVSNKKDNYDLSLALDLPRGWTLGAGYGIEIINRSPREVSRTQENTIKTTLRGRLPLGLMLNASYLSGKRAMASFDLGEYKNKTGTSIGTLIEQPGIRRPDVADRDRTEYNLALNANPSDNIALGVSYRNGANNYLPGQGDLTGGNAAWTNQMYGLLTHNTDGIGVNADMWLYDQTLQVSSYIDHSNAQFFERSNAVAAGAVSQLAINDWTIKETDNYDIVGIDITKFTPDERFSAGIGYSISAGKGKLDISDLASSSRVEQSPPDTYSQTSEFAIKTNAKVTDDLSVASSISYEQYMVDDYSTNNLRYLSGKNTTTGADSPNALFLGNIPAPYNNARVQVTTTYRF